MRLIAIGQALIDREGLVRIVIAILVIHRFLRTVAVSHRDEHHFRSREGQDSGFEGWLMDNAADEPPTPARRELSIGLPSTSGSVDTYEQRRAGLTFIAAGDHKASAPSHRKLSAAFLKFGM